MDINDIELQLKGIDYDPQSELLLFRGEFGSHSTIISGRKRPNFKNVDYLERTWEWIARTIIIPRGGSEDQTPALLQHYGYATDYVDLTSDLQVAIFFATNQFKMTPVWMAAPFRKIMNAHYENSKEGNGRLYILKIPKKLIESNILVDLSHLHKSFNRPLKQKGYLFHHPEEDINNLSQYISLKIDLDRSKVKSNLTEYDLFPSEKLDEVYSDLINVPYVSMYLDQNTPFALNFLDIPIYKSTNERHDKNHITVYSPPQYYGYRGLMIDQMKTGGFWDQRLDIKSSTKLIIPQRMWNAIDQDVEEMELGDIDFMSRNSYFLEMSQYYHGKHEIHEFPFVAYWLIKDGSKFKIFRFEVTNYDDPPGIYNSHTLVINADGKLVPTNEEEDCTCGEPENHFEEVKKVLFLIFLFEADKHFGIPHPGVRDTFVCGLS